MVGEATLASTLQALLGPDGVQEGAEAARYLVDGLAPQVVALPRTVEHVAQVLGLAHREGLAVVPWGGGTLMHIGNAPRRYDITLSLARLNHILEHEPADLTATVEAGCTLAAIQRRLAAGGQWLPLDPPRAEVATIGGILATSASGPCRQAYGSARDLVIGLQIATADGRLTRAGGKVVKNVAGYDLCKLHVGSLGTLGIIVEATFKVAPLPKAEASAVVQFHDATAACRHAAQLQRLGLALRALELLNSPAAEAAGIEASSPWLLAIWFAGSQRGVQRSLRHAMTLYPTPIFADIEHNEALSERLRDLTSPTSGLLCKASVLPSLLPDLLSSIGATAGPPRILARPSIGLVYVAWPPPVDIEGLLPDIRAAVANLGGSLLVTGCPPNLKAIIDVFGDPRSDFDLMRRIKAQFDAEGTLNPGRYLGKL
jgi:glycolate oxidase FAD binding subunit